MLGDDIGVGKVSRSGEPKRDFPLGFHWSTGQDLIGGLGLPAARNDHYQEAPNAVLTAAYLAGKTGRWLFYSRRRAFYAARHRYHGSAFTYRTVLAAVADGVGAGLLDEEGAKPGSRGHQSRYRATALLSKRLDDCPIHFEPRESPGSLARAPVTTQRRRGASFVPGPLPRARAREGINCYISPWNATARQSARSSIVESADTGDPLRFEPPPGRAEILPFPVTRRVAFMARAAAATERYSPRAANRYLASLVEKHAARLERLGVDRERAGADVLRLANALGVEVRR
jgi:hypothetical protein